MWALWAQSLQRVLVNPVLHMKWARAEQLPVSAAASFSVNEATIDLVLLAAIEQFEDQTTNRLLIAALEEYELGHNTKGGCQEDTSQNATINIVCVLYAFLLWMTITSKFEMWKLKIKHWISVASVLSHIVHLDTKYLMAKTQAGNLTLAGKDQVVF